MSVRAHIDAPLQMVYDRAKYKSDKCYFNPLQLLSIFAIYY